MKRSRCPHDRLYRIRGPRTKLVERREFCSSDPRLYEILVVLEACERCGRLREIDFKETMG